MKKSTLHILILLALSFAACEKNDIEVFNAKRQIYFDKFYMNALAPGTAEADTTKTSFFFYPDETRSVPVKLAVLLSGDLLSSDLQFGLKPVWEAGTAEPEDFMIEKNYTFHARPVPEGAKDIRDTIAVTLNHTDRLEEMGEAGIRLVLELVPNEAVDLGQFERRRAVIVWSNVEAQPEWWDYEVRWALLGEYSHEKYKLFLEVVPGSSELNGELVKNNPAKAIDLVNQFKAWLNAHLDDPEKGGAYKKILDSLV